MSSVTEKKPFFHAGRRELIAKTLMTLVQIAIGTGLASGFFLAKMSHVVKTGVIFSIFVLFVLGIWTCPDRMQKGE